MELCLRQVIRRLKAVDECLRDNQYYIKTAAFVTKGQTPTMKASDLLQRRAELLSYRRSLKLALVVANMESNVLIDDGDGGSVKVSLQDLYEMIQNNKNLLAEMNSLVQSSAAVNDQSQLTFDVAKMLENLSLLRGRVQYLKDVLDASDTDIRVEVEDFEI